MILITLLLFSNFAFGETRLFFSHYPVAKQDVTLAKDLSFNHSLSRQYRTFLRNELKQGPNFAGQFRVVEIPCGTGMVMVVILDTTNGDLIVPQQLETVYYPWPEDDAIMQRYGIDTRVNSSLLVIHGVPAFVNSLGTFFFQFDTSKLHFIKGFRWRSEYNKNN